MAVMGKTLQIKNLDEPDEVIEAGPSKIKHYKLGDYKLIIYSMEPGWRWSKDVKPMVGGELCQLEHVGIQTSGRMHIILEDGTEYDTMPNSFQVIPPGHDAYVVGDETVVLKTISKE